MEFGQLKNLAISKREWGQALCLMVQMAIQTNRLVKCAWCGAHVCDGCAAEVYVPYLAGHELMCRSCAPIGCTGSEEGYDAALVE